MFLSQAQAMPEPRNISTLACQVILASLCGGKINEIQRSEPGVASNSSVCNAWLKPQPQNDLFTTVLCIPQHLTSQPSRLNPTSVFLDIFALSGTISIQRAAQSQVGNDPVYADMLLHSKQRCLDAAFKVFRLMELSCHWDFRAVSSIRSIFLHMLNNTVLSRPLILPVQCRVCVCEGLAGRPDRLLRDTPPLFARLHGVFQEENSAYRHPHCGYRSRVPRHTRQIDWRCRSLCSGGTIRQVASVRHD